MNRPALHLMLALACFTALPSIAQKDDAPASRPVFDVVNSAEPHLVDVPLPAEIRRDPEPLDAPVLVNDGAGLLNADFSKWVQGLPLHWHITKDRESRVEGADPTDGSGNYIVDLNGGYNHNSLRQLVNIAGPAAEKTMVFTVDVKLGDDGDAKLVFFAVYDGNQKIDSEDHPGNGEWVRMEFRHTFPANFAGGMIDVGLVHYNDPRKTCRVRNPRIEFLP